MNKCFYIFFVIFVLLLNANAQEDFFVDAARNGNIEEVQSFILSGVDVNAKNRFGLTALMATRNKEIVEILIEAGVDVNAKTKNGDTALIIAAWGGHKEIVELLIANKAVYINIALDSAVRGGHKERVKTAKWPKNKIFSYDGEQVDSRIFYRRQLCERSNTLR